MQIEPAYASDVLISNMSSCHLPAIMGSALHIVKCHCTST